MCHSHIMQKISHREALALLSESVSIMLTCPAEGCEFRAKNDRSLTAHVRQCQRAAIGLASVVEKVEQHEADQWQAGSPQLSPWRLL